jgi:hypothetical protein
MHAAGSFQELGLEDELAEIFDFIIGAEAIRRGIHRREDGPGFSRRCNRFQQDSICVGIEAGFSLSHDHRATQQISTQRTGRSKTDCGHKSDDDALDKGTHKGELIISIERDDYCSPLVVCGYLTRARLISYSFQRTRRSYFGGFKVSGRRM